MGFFSEITGSIVKLTLTPVTVVMDIADTAVGNTPENTKKLVESSIKDAGKGLDDLSEGKL